MSDTLPSVTVLIAARPNQTEIKAVNAGKHLDYPHDKLEILVARGKQPSVQRNTAMKAARGELIYFLDDDSVPLPGNLRNAVAHFADTFVKMIGGPNLCPKDAPFLEQVFGLVHASWAFGPSRARYQSVGKTRISSEKELILCNLIGRRDDMLKLGGFDESLYPNEENALMDDLQKSGGKLLYDPGLIVYRRPRHSLKAFIKMLLNYGRGRAEQFRLHPTIGSAPNFVPPLFCVYILMLPFLGLPGLIPMALYAVALVMQSIALMSHGSVLQSLCAIPIMVITNIFYGLGFWRGLFTPVKKGTRRTDIAVELENVPL